ncbi:gamma-1-syntrophin-like isoform X1 [Haliotis asinina]|uniref:gamma-1-syntrophin-like isoform X1 n=1 Tax=Haliotis asinina TaxID=109174 RepID=UPI003532146D
MTEVKCGIVTLHDGRGKAQPIRLQLMTETLVIQKEEWVTAPLEEEDEVFLNMIREVSINREGASGLGLCVKGGAEHNLPVLISRIINGQAADRSGELIVGDAILQVNGNNVEDFTHDQVVKAMKDTEGNIVKLTVKHFRPASHFLNKGNSCNQVRSQKDDPPLSGPLIPGLPRLERQWTTVTSIPLLYGRLTRFLPGTDKLRMNSFEVFGCDGSSSGVLHCEDNRMLAEWIQSITSIIDNLLTQMVQMTNKMLLAEDHIAHMCWSQQRMSAAVHNQPWKAKFMALKGPEVFLFDVPPMHARDWTRCDMKYKVYECMFKMLKDEELPDDRQHCCSVQTGSGESIVLSVESRSDLLHIERAWYKTNSLAVHRIKNITFGCSWRGRLSGLTLDLEHGFSLVDHETKTYVWTYRFSQLKGSSDDGKTKLKLLFQNDLSRSVESREIECTSLHTLMFCVHAFLSAKLSSVDPSFLSNY